MPGALSAVLAKPKERLAFPRSWRRDVGGLRGLEPGPRAPGPGLGPGALNANEVRSFQLMPAAAEAAARKAGEGGRWSRLRLTLFSAFLFFWTNPLDGTHH